MARFKPYDYRQTKVLPVRFEEHILPGTFGYTLNRLIDESIDLTVFEARYRNDGGLASGDRIVIKDYSPTRNVGISLDPQRERFGHSSKSR